MNDTMLGNAEAWIMGGGVDAGPTSLAPTDGPVWVQWYHPSYSTGPDPWVEQFPTASHAVEEALDREHDSYYPTWLCEELVMTFYLTDPREDIRGVVYPVAEVTFQWNEDNDYTPVLSDV